VKFGYFFPETGVIQFLDYALYVTILSVGGYVDITVLLVGNKDD